MRICFYIAMILALPAFICIYPATAAGRVCMATGTTQTNMNLCADASYKHADARLNRQYQALAEHLADQPARRTLLIDAQRRWLAFRDAECRFDTSPVAGGSAAPMVRLQCLKRLTDRRNQRLSAYLTCSEGALSCPAPPSSATRK